MKKKKAPATPASSFANAAPKAPKAEKAAKKQVVIDYPVEGEIVTSQSYTVRLGAVPSERVEISIDGKDWQPCRESVGYWWFDWSGYNSGPHTIEARIPSTGKRFIKSKPRQLTALI